MIEGIGAFRHKYPLPPPATPASGGAPPPRPHNGTFTQSIFPGNNDTMPFYDQGNTNGCGTTSEAMILTYLLGRPVEQHDIDNQIRRVNTFTSPEDMVGYARRQGLSAEMYNHGSLSELQGFVARGIPCQVLINQDPSGALSSLHYVAVVGFGTDRAGNDCVVVHDPASGDVPGSPGGDRYIPVREFVTDWERPTGNFDKFFIAYAPGSTTLPAGRRDGIQGSLTTVQGVTNTANGFHRFVAPTSPGDYFHGIVQLPVGVGQTIGGGALAGVQLGSDWVHKKTDGVHLLKNVTGPVTDAVSAGAAAGSDLVDGAAAAADDVGRAAQDVVNGNLGAAGNDAKQVVTDVVDAGVNAVSDVGKGVGHVVQDLFRW